MIERNKFLIGWELETETVGGAGKDTTFASRPAIMPPPTLSESMMLDVDYYIRNNVWAWTTYDSNTLRAAHWSNKLLRKLFSLVTPEHSMWGLLAVAEGASARTSLMPFLDYARNTDMTIGKWVWIASGCPEDKSGLHPELREAMVNIARDALWGSPSDYRLTPKGVLEYLRDVHDVRDEYSIENDATVGGIEFKPIGPLDPDTSLASYAKLRKIFTEGIEPWTVSNRCSFHIHVSVNGMKHTYGPNMQAFMYLYLLQNIHRVPTRVLERWTNAGMASDGDKYFKMNLGGSASPSHENRYSFIAFRHEFKTWEFRCWGNIETVEDAKACVDLSLDAYNYAFDLVHKQKRAAPLKEIDTFSACLVEFANSYLLYPATGT
jgi:hypothetical protein